MLLELENAVPSGFQLNSTYQVIHGMIHGYLVLIYPMESARQYRIVMQLDVEQSTRKKLFLDYLVSLETAFSYVHYAGYNGKNTVAIHVAAQGGNDRENLENLLEAVALECQKYQLHTCCEKCGRNGEVYALEVDGSGHVLCENCAAQLIGRLEEQREEHIFLGFLGALIGAGIGSLLWLLIGQFGFIAGIAGYAIVFGSIKGYTKFGKDLSKAGVVICIVISILMIIAIEFFSLGITIYREFNTEYMISLLDAVKSVPGFMTYDDVRSGVFKDLLIGYAFAIWASSSFVKRLWITVKEKGAVHTVNKL